MNKNSDKKEYVKPEVVELSLAIDTQGMLGKTMIQPEGSMMHPS